MEKKPTPKKMKPRFKEGEIVWDKFIEKKIKFKYARDKYSQCRFVKINKEA